MTSLEYSFNSMKKRNPKNKKHIHEIFHLYSCRYFSACCYVDYLLTNNLIDNIDTIDKINLINYFTYLPELNNSLLSTEYNIYSFDSSFNEIRKNSVIVCYIYKKTSDGMNTIHAFILNSLLENDVVYNSWLTTESKNTKKTFSINELTGKRVYKDEQEKYNVLMSPTKNIVCNVYDKLVKLFNNPTLSLLKLLFGINDSDILIDRLDISYFKDAQMMYIKKI